MRKKQHKTTWLAAPLGIALLGLGFALPAQAGDGDKLTGLTFK